MEFWTILWITINAVALAWILYRVLYNNQFLLWDWHDGKFQFFWTDDKYRRNPRSF